MSGWRGTRGIKYGFSDLLHGRGDTLLWLSIALLIVATLARYGSRPRETDLLNMALDRSSTAPSLSVRNASGRDVLVLVGSGQFQVAYRLPAGANEPFLRLGGPLRLLDPVTCSTIANLDYPGSGSVVLDDGGRTQFTPGDREIDTPGIDSDITYACTGHVRAEMPAVAHPGTIVGIGDDRLWRLAADGSVASFLPNGRMPLTAAPLSDGRWLITDTTGWQSLNDHISNRWIADPATNSWTSFRDDGGALAFSPDGRWLAYLPQGKAALHLIPAISASATSSTNPTSAAGEDRILGTGADSFVWSPDSSRILVTSARSQQATTMDVDLVDLDGTRTPLIDGVSRGMQPAWSPDGRRVVVGLPGSGQDGWSAQKLLILHLTGRQIGSVEQSGEELGEASFSPDGRHLAFVVIRYPYPTNAEVGQLMIAAADGSKPVPSVDWLLGAGPAIWSPDGSSFVVARMEDTGPHQLVMGFVDGRPWKPIAESIYPVAWLP